MPIDRKPMPIALALRQRRKQLKLSQAVLAERAGYNANAIWAWETGYCKPSLPRLVDWAGALGLELTVKVKEHE